METDIEELYKEGVGIVRGEKMASASFLQRKLKIGYALSARLLDLMEERGIIGEYNGAKPREILPPNIEEQ